ncbi:hypothetical protein [Allomesorhizobium alhagi]|uniref:Gingipain domain-containing protein n=1 Tax=Mesorhizobium alhagi CCNWXJ12-2 TaxID=1107882 RepID=H0HQ94_9HYPH|nr:hypothetical protein [Mesorhizobium alhagi]EHK57120.1 hypothetical protein MAXJ12_11622 [Mesorhizobium alhagi CCNWXJ12-2]
MTLPEKLQLNAWSGGGNDGAVVDDYASRILAGGLAVADKSLPATPANLRDWRDPRVGWGIVLPARDSYAQHAGTVDDEPESICRLMAARPGAPIFRIDGHWTPGSLTRVYSDGRTVVLQLSAMMLGTGEGCIPYYLLIVGSPAEIPWEVQYNLQAYHMVGRLDLTEEGLSNYVNALISGWSDRPPTPSHSLFWSVDHGGGDITTLMRRTVSEPIYDRFANDHHTPALIDGARHLCDEHATGEDLAQTIEQHLPSLIVTSSHGVTSPLDEPLAMQRTLGVPVDAEYRALDPAAFTEDAAPYGALWFAQACCSAGANAHSDFSDLLKPATAAHRIVTAVTACGNVSAPLPRSLLSAKRPARGFVGHVEPTFDWSLRHPETGQYMTNAFRECFFERLFTGDPIGLALRPIREAGGRLRSGYEDAKERLIEKGDEDQLGILLAMKLAAQDWRSIVFLGDPTVAVFP